MDCLKRSGRYPHTACLTHTVAATTRSRFGEKKEKAQGKVSEVYNDPQHKDQTSVSPGVANSNTQQGQDVKMVQYF